MDYCRYFCLIEPFKKKFQGILLVSRHLAGFKASCWFQGILLVSRHLAGFKASCWFQGILLDNYLFIFFKVDIYSYFYAIFYVRLLTN